MRPTIFLAGESLLNDGVTIVLYNTMVALGGSGNPEAQQYVIAFFSFFTVVFGGLLIGIIVGMLCSYILKVHTIVSLIHVPPKINVPPKIGSYVISSLGTGFFGGCVIFLTAPAGVTFLKGQDTIFLLLTASD